jgi:hypothetical protein
MTEFIAGDVQEVTARVAYDYWERRRRPLWSAEIDWLVAESDLAASVSCAEATFSSLGLSPEPRE